MPINSIVIDPARGLPLLARLFKGEARDPNDERKTPKELPYFRLKWEAAYARYAPAFIERYGAEPTDIDGVLLLGDTPGAIFDPFMEKWGSSGLITRCDGATIWDALNPNTGRIDRGVMRSCPNPNIEGEDRPCGCKQVGRLSFMLPLFCQEIGVWGTFLLATHGWNDIQHIANRLDSIYMMNGTLRGLPFSLHRVPTEKSIPYKHKESGEIRRSKSTKYMVEIRLMEGVINMAALGLPAPIATAPALPATAGKIGPRPFASNSDATAFIRRMQSAWSVTPKQIVDALNVAVISEYVGTRERAEALVEAFATDSPPPRQIPAQVTPTDDLDRHFGKKETAADLIGNWYTVSSLTVQKASGVGNFSYVMHAATGEHILTFSGDVFRDADLNPDDWKKAGHEELFNPPLEVFAHNDGRRWTVKQVVAGMPA